MAATPRLHRRSGNIWKRHFAVANRRPTHVGLTGSIGMGKSETAKMFAQLGVPVYDADAAVHKLYQVGGAAVAPIEAAFPGTLKDGAVDRAELSRKVTGDHGATQRLQAIVYPLMADERRKDRKSVV